MKTGKCLWLGGCMVSIATVVGCGTTVSTLSGTDSSAAARQAQGQMGGMGLFGDPLNLTDDQKAQAKDIFDRLHSDTQPLFDQAKTDIRNVLTADQQAKLDELQANRPMPMGGGFGPPDGMRPGLGGDMGGMPPLPIGGPMGADDAAERQARLDQLATDLGLSDDQKAQIKTIQDNLHTAVEARRQQAMDEFRAILTADQIAILDQMKAMHDQGE